MCALLFFALLELLHPSTAVAANTVGGYCGGEGDGTNLTWELNLDTGEMVISGTGAMEDYPDSDGPPWDSYRKNLKTLIINEGVTTIGDWAFGYFTKLSGNLIIPDTITSIGEFAFFACDFTGNLTIPSSVTQIKQFAFQDCNKLTGSLIIPNSVTSIGKGAFYDCTGFTGNLIISSNIVDIASHAFFGCTGFSGNLLIPKGVKNIGNSAFQRLVGIKSVTIPNTVVTIGDGAFWNCIGLTDLVIPDSVTSIGYSSFFGCSGIDKVAFLGEAPSVIEAREGSYAPSFNIDTILCYSPEKSGWNYPIWNGYRTESLSSADISDQAATTILAGSYYAMQIIQAEDRETPVKNAKVVLAGREGNTDNNGGVSLNISGLDMSTEYTLTVTADGYQTYTNDAYTLKQSSTDTLWVSRYVKAINLTVAGEQTDVLLAERKLNKFYNDTPFSIQCESGEGVSIDRYVFRQGEREIETSTDGAFSFSNLDNLYAGTGTTEGRSLYIDIYQGGKKQATYPLNVSVINANMEEQLPDALSIGENIQIVIPDDYPIFGGMELNVPVPLAPLTCKIEGEKVHLGVNFDIGKRDDENKVHLLRLSGLDETDITKWMDKYYDAVATNKVGTLPKKTFSFEPQIIGYLEGSVHGDDMKGKIYISLKADFYREFQPMPAPPIVLEISVKGSVTAGGTLEIKQQEIKFYSDIEGGMAIGAYAGMGAAYLGSVGIYGEGEVGLKWILAAQTPEDRGLQEIYASGNFGIKAKMLGRTVAAFPLLETEKVYLYNRQTSLQTSRITGMPPLAGQSMSLRLMNALAEERVLEDEISLSMGAWSNGIESDSGAMCTIGESTYQDAQPQMVTSGSTSMLLLHGSDTTLQYSLYENGSWTSPAPISPDRTEDGVFHAAADGENIYVVWQDTKIALGEDETTETIAQNIDLVMAVYDVAEGTWGSEIPIKAQENSVAEILPQIDAEAGCVAIAWIENSANNMFGVCLSETEGETITNAICTATCTMPAGGTWGGDIQWSYGEAIVAEGHIITSLDVNALANEATTAIQSVLVPAEDETVATPDSNAQTPEATPAQTEAPMPTPQQTPDLGVENQPEQTPDATGDVQEGEKNQDGEAAQGGETIPGESDIPGNDSSAGNESTTAEDALPHGEDAQGEEEKQPQGELVTANLEAITLSSRIINAAKPMSLENEEANETMPDAAAGITEDTPIATPDVIQDATPDITPEGTPDTTPEATPAGTPETTVETIWGESTDETSLQGTGQPGGFCQILYTIDAGDDLLSTEEDELYYLSFSTESLSWIKSAALVTGAAAAQFDDITNAPVWWQNGEVYIGQPEGNIESAENVETGLISDKYVLLSKADGDQMLIYTAIAEGRTELFAISRESGIWGNPVQLTEQLQNIRHVAAAYVNGTAIAAFVQYSATAETESGNLCTMILPPNGEAKITAVTYDSADVMAGQTLPLQVTIENEGLRALYDPSVTVKGSNSQVLYSGSITQPILSGSQADVTLEVPLPETITGKETYTVQIGESSYEVEIGHALLKTGFELYYPGGSPNLVCYVRNDGYEPANGSLVIRDTATKVEVYRTSFEPLSNGELLHIEFALPLLDVTRSYSVEIETTAEQLYENGQEYIAVYPAKTEGDAYHDGYVNLADVLMLCRRIEDGETQHPYTVYVGDRGDGVINIDDAQYWLDQLAQSSPSQP